MVREWTGVDGEWCRMESLGREREGDVGGWVELVKECGSMSAIVGSRENGFWI